MVGTEAPPKKYSACWTRSFAAATWLMAKNHEVEGVELAKDGSGGIVFRFAAHCQPDLEDFFRAKDRLNQMALAARGR